MNRQKDVAHEYDGILLSHQKEQTGSFVVTWMDSRWMDLECVIQSEVSWKEKNKYHI